MTLTDLKLLAVNFGLAAATTPADVDAGVYWYNDYKGVRKMLQSLGWKYTIVGKYTKVIKVVGRNIILKRRSGLSDGQLPSPQYLDWMQKHIIPTADFYLPDGNAWTVQPVALRTASLKYKAYKHFTRTCADREALRDFDIHLGNVGWYKSRPVLIDW